ncbi:unnamed protein product, partial [Effrenium voratum]
VAMSAAGGVVSRQAWLRVLFGLCEFMNSREWRRGFEACGICGRGNLSTELSRLGLANYRAAAVGGVVPMPEPHIFAGHYSKSLVRQFYLLLQPTLPVLD